MQGAREFFYYLFNYKFTEESYSEILFRSVKISQNSGHESVAHFFGPPCIYNAVNHFTIFVGRQNIIVTRCTAKPNALPARLDH